MLLPIRSNPSPDHFEVPFMYQNWVALKKRRGEKFLLIPFPQDALVSSKKETRNQL